MRYLVERRAKGEGMYQELREKVGRARAKFMEARAQGKVTPELQRLADEGRAARRARDPVKLEKILDQILEKLKLDN